MSRRVIKTAVVDQDFFWNTLRKRGVYKLQKNDNPIIVSYSYRIVKVRDILPGSTIQATGKNKREILADWEYFTGEGLNQSDID